MQPPSIIRLNSTLPAAPTGEVNVVPQADGAFPINDVTFYLNNVGGVDPRTTVTETIGQASLGKMVTLTNAGAIAVTLDSSVTARYWAIANVLGAGTATLTPSSGLINGAANLAVVSGQAAILFFDGTDWFAIVISSIAFPITVPEGGTGDTTLTAHALLVGEGTSPVAFVGPGTTGYPLVAQGASADPAYVQPRGNTQHFQAADSTTNPTTNDLAKFDANGNIADAGILGTNVVTAAGTLTADQPVFGDGSKAIKVGTKSGNTNEVATVTGSLTSGNLTKSDASGNIVDAGVAAPSAAIATQAGVQAESYNYAADTGAANAYAMAPSPAIGSYVAGQEFAFLAAHTNTTTSTLAVSGLATKTIQKWSSGALVNLSAGDITAGQIIKVKYDGTVFQIVGGMSSGGGSGTVTHTGTLTSGQLIIGNGGADITVGNLSGDVTTSGSTVTTLANIPNDTPMAGDLLATNIAAPSTPASGKDRIYVDSTDKRLHDKNDAGTIGTTVVADTGATHNFLTAISAAGVISKAQPAAADLSDGTTGSGAVVLATGPTLSNPVVGTQSAGDNSTKAASTAYVDGTFATKAGVQAESYTYATDTGAANAYAIAPSPAIAAYVAGQAFEFIATHSNTTASTLAVSGLATKAITKNGTTALVSGDILVNQLVQVIYDGTRFQLINATANQGTVTNTGGALTADQPVFGAGGADIKIGTKRGNTDCAQMASNTSNPTTGNLAAFDANGNIVDGGAGPAGGSGAGFPFAGDGSDSVLAFDGTNTFSGIATTTGAAPNLVYTLVRDVYGTVITISTGIIVKTAQYRMFATVSITVNGTLRNNGAGTAAVSLLGNFNGETGLAGSLPLPNAAGTTIAGASGGNGGATNGNQGGVPLGGSTASNALATAQYAPANWTSGKGGDAGANTGGANRSAGAAGSNTTTSFQPHAPMDVLTNRDITNAVHGTTNTAGAAGGGGGGAGDGTAGGAGGAGGGQGGHGGFMVICCPTITVGAAGVISADGAQGNGGTNGTAAGAGNRGGGGGGAGGGGGNGGCIYLVYHSLTNSGAIHASAGAAGALGTGGAGTGTGQAGANGQNGPTGAAGFVIQVVI